MVLNLLNFVLCDSHKIQNVIFSRPVKTTYTPTDQPKNRIGIKSAYQGFGGTLARFTFNCTTLRRTKSSFNHFWLLLFDLLWSFPTIECCKRWLLHYNTSWYCPTKFYVCTKLGSNILSTFPIQRVLTIVSESGVFILPLLWSSASHLEEIIKGHV